MRFSKLALALILSAFSFVPLYSGIQTTLFFNYKDNLATNNPTVTNSFNVDRAAIRFSDTFFDRFSGAFQLDLDTTAANSAYFMWIKEAWLGWNIIPELQVIAGMQQSTGYKVQEDLWNHRYVYKSFVDQNSFLSTFDLGLSVRARLFSSNLMINFAVLNGEGFKKLEANNIFNYALSAGHESKLLTLYAYADFQPFTSAPGATSNTGNQFTFASVAGVKISNIFRFGIEYNALVNKSGSTNAGSQLGGLSAYAAVSPLSWLEVFGRFDYMWSGVNAAQFYTIVAGIQFTPPKYNKVAGALTFKTTQYPWSYGATVPSMSIGLDFLASWTSKDAPSIPKAAAAPAPKPKESEVAPKSETVPAAVEEKKQGG